MAKSFVTLCMVLIFAGLLTEMAEGLYSMRTHDFGNEWILFSGAGLVGLGVVGVVGIVTTALLRRKGE